MKSVVIVIAGHKRSGKGTLIKAIGDAVANHSEVLDYPTFSPLSSIDPVKHGIFPILNMLGVPLFNEGTPDLTKECRSLLASTKEQLDKHFKFTQAFLALSLKTLGANSIVTYEVREFENIEELHRLAGLKSSKFDVVTVWVERPNNPHEVGINAVDVTASKTKTLWPFDLYVTSHLDDMEDWANLIMKYVVRKREAHNADV